MDVREQNEHIRAKNREAVSKAYENSSFEKYLLDYRTEKGECQQIVPCS